MSAEHSKLPFAIERDTGDGTAIDTTLWIVTKHDADKATVARIDEPDAMDERNAQYIVKACNAYDTLIGALGQIAYTHEHMSDEQMTENDGYVAVLMRQIARDALASAQGDK